MAYHPTRSLRLLMLSSQQRGSVCSSSRIARIGVLPSSNFSCCLDLKFEMSLGRVTLFSAPKAAAMNFGGAFVINISSTLLASSLLTRRRLGMVEGSRGGWLWKAWMAFGYQNPSCKRFAWSRNGQPIRREYESRRFSNFRVSSCSSNTSKRNLLLPRIVSGKSEIMSQSVRSQTLTNCGFRWVCQILKWWIQGVHCSRIIGVWISKTFYTSLWLSPRGLSTDQDLVPSPRCPPSPELLTHDGGQAWAIAGQSKR